MILNFIFSFQTSINLSLAVGTNMHISTKKTSLLSIWWTLLANRDLHINAAGSAETNEAEGADVDCLLSEEGNPAIQNASNAGVPEVLLTKSGTLQSPSNQIGLRSKKWTSCDCQSCHCQASKMVHIVSEHFVLSQFRYFY